MFKKHFFSTVILLTLTFGIIVCESEKDWTYLVFAQEWPPAACLNVPHGGCKIPKGVIGWTIHGLWPTCDSGYPSFCNTSWPFDPNTLKSILPDLEVKWPNIYADSTENAFWKHEWLKHGTCAASDKKLRGELNYFKRSIELHDKFNIDEILRKASIRPDEKQPQSLKYIENTINLQLQKRVKIFCKDHKNYTSPILDSLYICTDRNLTLIDCDEVKEPSCDKTYVLYLPFAETSLKSKTRHSKIDPYYRSIKLI